eukprot:2028713-Karenia_brevis.AAC.1
MVSDSFVIASPSWHRNQRRSRSKARVVAKSHRPKSERAAAEELPAQHHSNSFSGVWTARSPKS